MSQPYVIFDRDGTLIEFIPYLDDERGIIFKPDIIQALLELKQKNFKFGIITNQSGIARGLFDKLKVEKINQVIDDYLRSFNLYFSFIFYCPHHPDEKCICRKPNTFLGERAIREFNIDPEKSFMVGDQESDLQFGLAIGIRVIQLRGTASRSPLAHHYSDTLMDAASWILKQ